MAAAQTTSWAAPSGGFVFDSSARAIRPITGFVGSGVFGTAILSGIDWAAIAPNQKSALVSQNSALVWIPDLNTPAQSQSLGWIPDATRAIWSADSTRAVVVTRTSVLWLAVSNQSVSLEAQWHLSGVRTEWGLMAADSAAKSVLLVAQTRPGRTSFRTSLWFAAEATSPVPVAFAGHASAAVFANNSSSIFIADAVTDQIFRVDQPQTQSTAQAVLNSSSYVSDASGLILSSDDSRIFITDRATSQIGQFDASTGGLITSIATDAGVGSAMLFAPGLFLLDPAQSNQPFMFFNLTNPTQVIFLPRGN